mmetsp:Transcript_26950/g.78886  ORF Transcript_26950/g.78886 Transcript_26950/m.78886 type:complete len:94 (+) Transcript_26950:597-878(+)|eukprot:3915993-Prymnesium_polylepis.1
MALHATTVYDRQPLNGSVLYLSCHKQLWTCTCAYGVRSRPEEVSSGAAKREAARMRVSLDARCLGEGPHTHCWTVCACERASALTALDRAQET